MLRSFPIAFSLALALVAGCDASLGDGAGTTDASVQGTPDAPPAPTPDARQPPGPDAPPPPDAQPCIEGDAQVEDTTTGTCYIYVAQLTTWDDARIACADLGGHLAVSTSLAENNLFSPLAGLLDVWIGGTDADTEALWLWITGETMGFTNWRTGEPNNGGTSGNIENCMIIEGDNGGLWDDRPCGHTYGYICER